MQSLSEGMQEFVQVDTQVVAPGLVEVGGLPPGRLDLRVTTSKGAEPVVHLQRVEESGDAQLDASAATTPFLVSGVLKLEDGLTLIQPANVELRNLATGEVLSAQSGPDGEFSFKQNPVPVGKYEILVFEPAGMAVRSASATGAKVLGHTLQIDEAQDVRVNVVLTAVICQITGFALKDGKPAAGVMVVLVPQDIEHNSQLVRQDQSDSDGSFTLGSVPPGSYTVLAIEDGWDLEWADPDALRKYAARGEVVQITASGKLEVKVKVQSFRQI
jgi:hypothetical protein